MISYIVKYILYMCYCSVVVVFVVVVFVVVDVKFLNMSLYSTC